MLRLRPGHHRENVTLDPGRTRTTPAPAGVLLSINLIFVTCCYSDERVIPGIDDVEPSYYREAERIRGCRLFGELSAEG